MKQDTILIKSYGFFGDILFTIPSVILLRQQFPDKKIEFHIGFPQPYEIIRETLRNVPNVEIHISPVDDPMPLIEDEVEYFKVYTMPECNRLLPPHIQYQRSIDPSIEKFLPFNLSVPRAAVERVNRFINRDTTYPTTTIGVVANWDRCTFKYSDEAMSAIKSSSVDDFLGHRFDLHLRRNITNILRHIGNLCLDEKLKVKFQMLGFSYGQSQRGQGLNSISTYTDTAALITQCDLVIGPEGGMTNLAAGLNTPTVITTDFMWGLYGPLGILQQLDDPQLGPEKFIPKRYPYAPHKSLLPNIADDQIAHHIVEFLTKEVLNPHNSTSYQKNQYAS